MENEPSLLRWAVNYELRCCERYRRFMSVVYVSHEGRERFPDAFSDVLRSSDVLVKAHSSSALLMGETSKQGALRAVERFKSQCGDLINMKYAVASYPTDGRTADDLLSTVRERLAAAMNRENGVVVWSSTARQSNNATNTSI
ncbi:MAG: hypothetical protein HZB26_19420 [Candidatus Hydrogenedentes bacterium]|nr:hypothetical protein [Candidatus Hydrogenedentota bacterium]